jgi:hypothetical protein
MERIRAFLWSPVGWIAFQLAEFVVVGAIAARFLPEDPGNGATTTVMIVALVGLSVLNLRIRRRFLPIDAPPDPAEFSARSWFVTMLLLVVVVYAYTIVAR